MHGAVAAAPHPIPIAVSQCSARLCPQGQSGHRWGPLPELLVGPWVLTLLQSGEGTRPPPHTVPSCAGGEGTAAGRSPGTCCHNNCGSHTGSRMGTGRVLRAWHGVAKGSRLYPPAALSQGCARVGSPWLRLHHAARGCTWGRAVPGGCSMALCQRGKYFAGAAAPGLQPFMAVGTPGDQKAEPGTPPFLAPVSSMLSAPPGPSVPCVTSNGRV